MKDAIIKEIRKTDEKAEKGNDMDANPKKKRNRINNKERVDINTAEAVLLRKRKQSKNTQQGGGKHNKDRFKKAVVKPEVSDEDVAKQVKRLWHA